MATRVIYMNPHDIVELRVINDPDLPRNAKEWGCQVRPEKIVLQHKGFNVIGYADPSVRFENSFASKPRPTA